MTHQLRLTLLGRVDIQQNQQTVAGFYSQKTEALFYYLALTKQRQLRSALAGLFWGDLPENRAQANLRKALSSLRQLVGPHLEITRQSVTFNRDVVYWLDVEEFESLVDQGDIASLQRAVALYQGDLLMGFTVRDAPDFEMWLLVEQERLRGILMDVLQRLISEAIQDNGISLAQGLSYANQRLALDTWREESHRFKMMLLALQDQRSAALAQYNQCQDILWDNLGVEPGPEITALYEQIRDGTFPQNRATLLAPQSQLRASDDTPISSSWSTSPSAWPDVPQIHLFYGRETELSTLQQWLIADQCRLVAILGMGGQGKTALAAKFVSGLAQEFSQVIWVSLLNAPPFETFLHSIMHHLTDTPDIMRQATVDEQLSLILAGLRRERLLLVLDNMESIMHPEYTGQFRPGYEVYGQLLRWVAERQHQSCLLLTSREAPKALVHLNQTTPLVKRMDLAGLSAQDGGELLLKQGLMAQPFVTGALVERYSGNPLALNLVGQSIQDFYLGDVDAFLGEETLIFADIRDVLDQQFDRLSPLEQDILLWLTIVRKGLLPAELRELLVKPVRQREFLEALQRLKRRSLIEGDGHKLTLQNVIIEYGTDRIIEQSYQELVSGHFDLLHSHTLVEVSTLEYIRQTQFRLIMDPLSKSLLTHFGETGLSQHIQQLLETLRQPAVRPTGYIVGNIINLLVHLQLDLTGYDFSRLQVKGAYLTSFYLQDVDFTEAHFSDTIFSETFGVIIDVAISPDGQWLAGGTNEGEVRLWDARTRQPEWGFTVHSAPVWSVAFSPDSQMLAVTWQDNGIGLWYIADNLLPTRDQPHIVLHGHTQAVLALDFSPNGKLLASGSEDGTVRLWDMTQLKPDISVAPNYLYLSGHEGWVWSVAFAPDSQTLFSGGDDGLVHIWHIPGNIERMLTLSTDVPLPLPLNHQTLAAHQARIWAVRFSPTGQIFATASSDKQIRLWQKGPDAEAYPGTDAHPPINQWQPYHIFSGHKGRVVTLAFSPDGKLLMSGSSDFTVRVWDVHTQDVRHVYYKYMLYAVYAVAFSPDGKSAVFVSEGDLLAFVDTYSWQVTDVLWGHIYPATSVAFSPTGQILASGADNGIIHLWSCAPPNHLPDEESRIRLYTREDDWVMSLAFTSQGQFLASGGSDNNSEIFLWDLTTLNQPNLWGSNPTHRILGQHLEDIEALAFNQAGTLLASASRDHIVGVWDVETGRSRYTLIGHQGQVQGVAFVPNGHLLLSGSMDHTLRLWSMTDEIVLNAERIESTILIDLKTPILSIALSPKGDQLVASCGDNAVYVWDVQPSVATDMIDLHLRHQLAGHTAWPMSVMLSPDGQRVASGSMDKTIRLWHTQTGALEFVLEGHTDQIWSIAFSPDGQFIASASHDTTVKIWDAETGRCLRTLKTPGPNEGMNITGATGLTQQQKLTLKQLGAVEDG